MRPELAFLKRLALVALLCVPFADWAFYKPVRLLAPSLADASCITNEICTDAPSRKRDATELYDEAIKFVEAKVGRIESRPHVVFCESEACAQSFGLGRSTA